MWNKHWFVTIVDLLSHDCHVILTIGLIVSQSIDTLHMWRNSMENGEINICSNKSTPSEDPKQELSQQDKD